VTIDVGRVRGAFPALDHGVAHFDGPGGSQVPQAVADAVARTLVSGISNRGVVTDAERRADDTVLAARAAVADLLGADPGGVVFGRSMTQLTYDVARALAKTWEPGDEVVVTRLDHDANIRPWVRAAELAGATVRWAGFDRTTGELDPAEVAALVGDRTRLVAVTGASNLLGTRPDVAAVSAAAHAVGAVVYVDGVHLSPHTPVDVGALGADFFACSPYKFFGPHLGAVVADPDLLERVHPDKLLPSTDAVPERFELGTLPYELLAGVTATVDFIADLVPGTGSRRARVLASMAAVEEHEDRLYDRLAAGLRGLGRVTMHGSPARHTPTVLFTVDGVAPREVHEKLGAAGVNAPAGSFYALEASRWLGLGDGGAVRAGLAPYTDEGDVDRLLAGVAQLSG
jgi:cysteine desulfurase family protein (TIGR01976 family)